MPDTQHPDAPILLRRDAGGGVVWFTLNRPDSRNALSVKLMHALDTALAEAGADPEVRVVVLAGTGPAFCAGHDLREIRAHPGHDFTQGLFQQCSALMTRIVRLPKPVIASVHATATAAGCQLVASCDLAVAASTAQFATPGVNIGLFCSTPMVALTRNVAPKHAMDMLLTGDAITAARAHDIGLVNRVVAPEALLAETEALARQIASKSARTIAIGKEAFYRQIDLPLDEAYRYAAAAMTRNMMARDAAEGIDAFLAKRAPVWTDS